MPSYLITGVNRGIGYGWIKYLAQQSPSNLVIGTVRNKADQKFISRLESDNLLTAPNLHIFEADVTDVAALQRIESEISAVTHGALDVLVNNAGFITSGNDATLLCKPSEFTGKEELLKSELDAAMNVNVLGCAYVTNVFLPQLRKGTLKKIVMTSSANGDARHPDGFSFEDGIAPALPYSISKAAVNMLAVKYAIELKKEGFVVLALCPGLVNNTGTPKTAEENERLRVKYGPGSVNQRFKGFLEPEESVTLQLEVINNATVEDSGRFLSEHGDDSWW